jgi:Ca2+/Na+ antiporter
MFGTAKQCLVVGALLAQLSGAVTPEIASKVSSFLVGTRTRAEGELMCGIPYSIATEAQNYVSLRI